MSPFVLLLALQGASSDYAKDPLYAKPITVELAMTPLRKVVEAMATASGKPLRVGGAVADLKATVLVKALPTGRTMEALADALGLVWKPEEGGVMRLDRADGAAREEAAYLKEEVRLATPPPEATGGPNRRPGSFFRRDPNDPEAARPGGPRGVVSRFDPDLLAMQTASAPPPSRLKASVANDSPFLKAANAWATLPSTVDPAWLKPIAPAFPKSPYLGGALSLSDLLTAWHASSGLPVVADAFRVPMKSKSLLPSGALAVLQTLASNDGLSLKFADGVARMRHPAYWRLRAQEIPESTWATLERTATPNLASLSAFASRLTSAQAASFRSAEPPLSKSDTEAIERSYPALLLWSALPGAARDALLAGRPVGISQASGATNAYVFALREAPYYEAGDPTEVLRMNAAKVGILATPSEKTLSLRLADDRGRGVTYALPR